MFITSNVLIGKNEEALGGFCGGLRPVEDVASLRQKDGKQDVAKRIKDDKKPIIHIEMVNERSHDRLVFNPKGATDRLLPILLSLLWGLSFY